MISEEEARAKILENLRPLPARRLRIDSRAPIVSGLSILKALDCFAAEDYFARLPLPNFDNSAMDGYAVVASSCAPGKRLRVVGEQAAGLDQQLRASAGDAIRIFTGAPMPAGADAIVMQEDVTREGGEIVVNVDVDPGEFVRRRGCDLGEGQKILARGERIRAATTALLASQGFSDVMVGGEVSAAIISPGDELVKPEAKLQPGQIYESNSVLLQGLLHNCGAAERLMEHCRDDEELLTKALKRAIKHRVVIVSGGVSVGERDIVKSALQSLGAKIDFWRVAIKPGKPFLFGHIDECDLFGLPGNPVSAFVTFLQFVRPAILKMMGTVKLDLLKVSAKLLVDLTNDSDRVHYIRGKFEDGIFTPVGRQESHALFGLSQSNALLRLAVGESRKRDAIVNVQVWD